LIDTTTPAGRQPVSDDARTRVVELRRCGMGVDRIARELGIGNSTMQNACREIA
jgi:hypothetical protein